MHRWRTLKEILGPTPKNAIRNRPIPIRDMPGHTKWNRLQDNRNHQDACQEGQANQISLLILEQESRLIQTTRLYVVEVRGQRNLVGLF